MSVRLGHAYTTWVLLAAGSFYRVMGYGEDKTDLPPLPLWGQEAHLYQVLGQ